MIPRSLAFPFEIADRGVALASYRERAVREQIEQLLFTMPGERVDRPGYGCGVQALVFAGASPETIAATEFLVSTAIRRFMEEVVELDAVRVHADRDTLYIDVLYTLRSTGEELAASVVHPLVGQP